MAEENELASKLARQVSLNEGEIKPKLSQRFNPATEFPEMSFKEIKEKEKLFRKVTLFTGLQPCVTHCLFSV